MCALSYLASPLALMMPLPHSQIQSPKTQLVSINTGLPLLTSNGPSFLPSPYFPSVILPSHRASLFRLLHCLCPREQTAVNRIYDRLCRNLPAPKEAPVQALDRILAALHTVKLEIDVAGRVVVESNVHDMAVLLLALGAHVVFEFFDPGVALFSVEKDRISTLLKKVMD